MNWTARIVISGLLGCIASASYGESNNGGYIEEIVVTAQKREQSIKDVPVSMTVMDEELLKLKGFSRFDDIAFGAANMAITNPTGSRAVQFTIRGVTGQTFFPGAESGVGVFVDGIYLNNPPAQNFDLLDVERIEVLRGPQGTLYGKNTVAGAINVITRKPDEETRLSLVAEAGNENHRRLRLGASGQLADGLYGAIGVGKHTRDGFQDNTFLGSEFDDADSWNMRSALRYLPNDKLELNLSLDYMHEDIVPAALDATPEDRRSAHNRPSFEERDVKGVAFTVDYDLTDTISLTSISSWREYETTRGGDDDGVTIDAYFTSAGQDTSQLSQEIRFASTSASKFQWLAGVYYLESELMEHSVNNLFPDPLFQLLSGITCTDLFTFQFLQLGMPPAQAMAAAAAFCVDTVADHMVDHDAQTMALFGQFSYDFTEQLRLTAGLRASWEEKEFRIRQPGPGGALFLLPGVDSSFDRDDTAVDPMISLSYSTDSTNYYATVSRGSKSGGFNTGAVGDASQLGNVEFDEETLYNYEVGLKTLLLDGRLDINLAAFYMDYQDLQVFRIEANSQGVPVSRITNVAEAVSRGVELDFQYQPIEAFSVRGSLGYLHARYEDYSQCGQDSIGTLLDCTDNRLTNAPGKTANLNLSYTIPLGQNNQLLLNAEWAYRGDVYYDVFNTDGAFQSGFSIVNANIVLAEVENRWSVSLWGKNLTDKEYITIGVQGFGGIPINTLGTPRQYGVRVALQL
jgi:iron complex outermembrane receptor protein